MNRLSYSQKLAETIEDLTQIPMSQKVIESAKICFLDYLACATGGADTELGRTTLKGLSIFGKGSARLIGRAETSSPIGAAFFNGIVTTAEELDDSHRFVTGYHPSATILPALCAAVEGKHVSGRNFIKAMVAGYEVSGRVCRAIERGHRAKGFHSTATVGPLGAAAAACISLNAGGATLADALGIAGSACAGLFAFLEDGAMGKHTHPGRASADGLVSAMLAMTGMAGPRTIFESKDGFLNAYSNEPVPEEIIKPLSDHLQILDTYHKVHSACGHAYPALDALFNLKHKVPNLSEQLEHMEVRVYKAATGLRRSNVTSITEARFSIPYLVGMAIVLGSINRQDWHPDVLKNAQIRKFASMVDVVEDPNITARFPAERCGEIVVTLKDGSTISQKSDAPFGMPENPVSWRDMTDKFQICTNGIFDQKDQQIVIDLIENIERLSSMDDILTMFVP